MDSNEKRGVELVESVSRFRYVFENRRIGVRSLAEILPIIIIISSSSSSSSGSSSSSIFNYALQP
jgi:hypothetical protein